MQGIRNAPPPFSQAVNGKRQMFPKPTLTYKKLSNILYPTRRVGNKRAFTEMQLIKNSRLLPHVALAGPSSSAFSTLRKKRNEFSAMAFAAIRNFVGRCDCFIKPTSHYQRNKLSLGQLSLCVYQSCILLTFAKLSLLIAVALSFVAAPLLAFGLTT